MKKVAKRKPLTVEEVKKEKCFRCGKIPCYTTWNICADENRFRTICFDCDIKLNETVLYFMGIPEDEIEEIMRVYIHGALLKYRDMMGRFPKGWEDFVETYDLEYEYRKESN